MVLFRIILLACAAAVLCACASSERLSSLPGEAPGRAERSDSFSQDRAAILAMAGDYKVTFDFRETTPFVEGYEPKERYRSGAYESVRVIEDRGDFISLQHILVVGGEDKFPIKHWRQDWSYEPESVLVFVGGAAWENRPVKRAEARGKWSQTVYQVDDAPRYGAVAAWSHKNGVSEWTPPAELRPLPRRDATKRNDYHAINAVNRHAIAPFGWVHEQDNAKLALLGGRQTLVREIGVNTYRRSTEYDVSVADEYWGATEGYWRAVREIWASMVNEHDVFGLTMQGEPSDLYMPLLELAEDLREGAKSLSEARREAQDVIDTYTTTDIGDLQSRLSSQTAEDVF
ncbi:MAG: DUF6607 family protein [Pseudomonadota bacterium]